MNRPPFQPVLRDQTAWFQPLSTDKRMAAAVYQMKPGDAGTCVWDSDQLLPYIWNGQSWSLFSTGSGSGGGASNYSGIGSPEGVVAAAVGSMYMDITTTSAPQIWWKTSGGATNTGWTS